MNCGTVIDFRHPVRSEKRHEFQLLWRLVYIYRCPTCGKERHIYADTVPDVGGIVCGG